MPVGMHVCPGELNRESSRHANLTNFRSPVKYMGVEEVREIIAIGTLATISIHTELTIMAVFGQESQY